METPVAKSKAILLAMYTRLRTDVEKKRLTLTGEALHQYEITAGNRFRELSTIEEEFDQLLGMVGQLNHEIQKLQATIYRMESENGKLMQVQLSALLSAVTPTKEPYQDRYSMESAYRRAESRTQFLLDNPDFAQTRNLHVSPDPNDPQLWEIN